MKTLISCVIAASLTVVAASCKKDEKPGTCAIDSPWYKDGARHAYKNNSPFIDADSLIVTIKKLSDTRFESRSDAGLIGFGGFQEICGSKLYAASTAEFSDTYLLYDLDAKVGDSWSITQSTFQGNSVVNTMTMMEKNVALTVPAGTYTVSVIKIESKIAGMTVQTAHMYVAEGLGLIKMIGTTTDYELGSSK